MLDYRGRGRTPLQLPPTFDDAVKITKDNSSYFMREENDGGLDGIAFHYSIYRSLTRFMGMDGNLAVAYDTDINFVTSYNQIVQTNDYVNLNTGDFDPRHM